MKQNRLDILGQRLRIVDRHLVSLLARRIRLAYEVAMIKLEDGQEIYRPEVEEKRLKQVHDWSIEEGINPHFARSILYPVIGESCKNQIGPLDEYRLKGKAEKFNPTYKEMRENLIRLTDSWAHNYDSYAAGHPATEAIFNFEHQLIDSLIPGLRDRDLCLELGCATGNQVRRLKESFVKLIGFDISQTMIQVGEQKISEKKIKNIGLSVQDIEKPWTKIKDGSVSMIVMNNGVGSDIQNLDFVLSEIVRVLKPRGRFVMSFYNKDAWSQRVFFPWPLGLVANVDQDRNCLEVKFENEFLSIFAKPYTIDEIRGMIPNHLSVLGWSTYPTLMSILPKNIVEETKPFDILKKIDLDLSENDEYSLGSYLIFHGEKC